MKIDTTFARFLDLTFEPFLKCPVYISKTNKMLYKIKNDAINWEIGQIRRLGINHN